MHRLIRLLTALSLLALAFGGGVLVPDVAGAAEYNVTNANNSGAGSLRQALANAESNPGADTVAVQAGVGTITLSSPIIWSTGGGVTIQGNGVTIDANGETAALYDDSGQSLTIEDLTITGVGGASSIDTAPVVAQGGSVTARDCTITGNEVYTDDGDAAGGILSEGGAVLVDSCTISDNTATTDDGDVAGGVLSEGGLIDLLHCTITGNDADGPVDAGGGVLSEGGPIMVDDCDISGNTATSDAGDAGGGLHSQGGQTVMARSTVNDNRATGGTDETAVGGSANIGGSLTVRSSTISGNAAVGDGWVAAGGLQSYEDVSISESTIQCNTAENNGVPEEEGSNNSVGGVYGEGYTFALNGDTFIGNTATGNDIIEDHYLYTGGFTPSISGTTSSDDTSSCQQPTPTTTTTIAAPTTTAPESPAAVPAAAQPQFTG